MDKKELVNVNSFTISVKNVQGYEYSGTFTVHRPNMGELIRIGVKEAGDLGGLTNVDLVTSLLAHMICTLEVLVDTHPDWWKPREIKDMEVVQEVFDKLQTFLREFQIPYKPKPENPGPTGSL